MGVSHCPYHQQKLRRMAVKRDGHGTVLYVLWKCAMPGCIFTTKQYPRTGHMIEDEQGFKDWLIKEGQNNEDKKD